MTKKPILCVDFDGVIHTYVTPWSDAETVSDGPVPGAIAWLALAIDKFEVHIYSARSKSAVARVNMEAWLRFHCEQELGWDHPLSKYAALLPDGKYPIIFSAEKPAAFLTIDDRAVCFTGSFELLQPEFLLRFKPWNKQ